MKRKMMWLWLLLLLLAVSCTPATINGDAADFAEVEVVTTAPLPTDDKPPPAFLVPDMAEIRLYNNTGLAFESVTITFPDQVEPFGPIAFGQYSDYRPIGVAYPFAAIAVTTADGDYLLQPRDFVGVDPLPAGRYTYELSLENDHLGLALIDDYPLLTDARYMAEDLGIPLEEALAQLADQDAIGVLGAQLEANEAATFAGLWIEREPVYRVAVAFTENGAETVAGYVAGTELEAIIAVLPAERTLAELRQIQAETTALMAALDFPFASGISVQTNIVELYITDEARFNAALDAAGATVPDGVNVVVTYEPAPAPPPGINPVPDVFMPQLTIRSAGFMEALLIGTLAVEDGCLLVNQDNGDRQVVIWQPEHYLSELDGDLVVLDRDGVVVATVGEPIYLGGGEISARNIDAGDLAAPLPDSCTSANYWLMGQFLPAEYIPNVTQ